MQNIMIRTVEKLSFQTKEAYKTLRTNLEFSGPDVKVIVMTSCMENEGKTSVSFQLALSLAEAGKKTILVDADLRKSVMYGRYKATRGKYGLSHYLSGQVQLEEAVCTTNIPGLHIIFAGLVPPNPSELLGNDYFKKMIQFLRLEYDYVIVDTPPLGSVIDSAIVARECDGVILVIEANAVSHKFARMVKEQIDRAECRLLGCVLNKVEMKNSAYYSKYYGKYYGKREEERKENILDKKHQKSENTVKESVGRQITEGEEVIQALKKEKLELPEEEKQK